MDQKRRQSEDVPSRASDMEQADSSRERMRNRSDDSGRDLGTSSDRAMYNDSERSRSSGSSSGERGGSSSSSERGSSSASRERGSGSSGERNREDSSGSSRSSGSSSSGGGISNRELERERCEQEQLPDRGTSQSER